MRVVFDAGQSLNGPPADRGSNRAPPPDRRSFTQFKALIAVAVISFIVDYCCPARSTTATIERSNRFRCAAFDRTGDRHLPGVWLESLPLVFYPKTR